MVERATLMALGGLRVVEREVEEDAVTAVRKLRLLLMVIPLMLLRLLLPPLETHKGQPQWVQVEMWMRLQHCYFYGSVP